MRGHRLLGGEITLPEENRQVLSVSCSILGARRRRNQLHQKAQTRKIPHGIELRGAREKNYGNFEKIPNFQKFPHFTELGRI